MKAPIELEPPSVTPRVISFTVWGTPVPQGSTRAFIPKGWKRAIITTDNKQLKPWRQEVSGVAAMQAPGCIPFPAHIPVEITLNFYFTKPKGTKRPAMTVRPDLDKICRSCFDAITGILIRDDSQIVELHARKHYGGPDRVTVEIREAIV